MAIHPQPFGALPKRQYSVKVHFSGLRVVITSGQNSCADDFAEERCLGLALLLSYCLEPGVSVGVNYNTDEFLGGFACGGFGLVVITLGV
jgi:hypothetical protein